VSQSGLQLSVIVPARNASSTLGTVLGAIRASKLPPNSYEIIVVDDCSGDTTAAVAARHADVLVRLNGRIAGPAYARNRGAEVARGEVIAFVDVDVLVAPDTLPRMLNALNASPTLAAVSASRDDDNKAPNFVTEYWNLLLRFGEERYSAGRAHFASGCGAVRREVLESVGKYDEWRFATGCLESLELGQRLHEAGHDVQLDPSIKVTHLTEWTVGAVCREVWRRSVLLARSLGYQRTRAMVPGEVVFTLSRALTPIVAIGATLSLAAAFLPSLYVSSEMVVAVAALLLANHSMHSFFAKSRGIGFAVAAAPLHLCVQGVSAVALCAGWILRDAVGDIVPDATTQAYSEVGLHTWPPIPRRP